MVALNGLEKGEGGGGRQWGGGWCNCWKKVDESPLVRPALQGCFPWLDWLSLVLVFSFIGWASSLQPGNLHFLARLSSSSGPMGSPWPGYLLTDLLSLAWAFSSLGWAHYPQQVIVGLAIFFCQQSILLPWLSPNLDRLSLTPSPNLGMMPSSLGWLTSRLSASPSSLSWLTVMDNKFVKINM